MPGKKFYYIFNSQLYLSLRRRCLLKGGHSGLGTGIRTRGFLAFNFKP